MDLRISVYFHSIEPVRLRIKWYIFCMFITACFHYNTDSWVDVSKKSQQKKSKIQFSADKIYFSSLKYSKFTRPDRDFNQLSNPEVYRFDLIWFDLNPFDLIWFDLIWIHLIWIHLIWIHLILNLVLVLGETELRQYQRTRGSIRT